MLTTEAKRIEGVTKKLFQQAEEFLPTEEVKNVRIGIEKYADFYNSFEWDEQQEEMQEQKFLHTLSVTCKMLELSKEVPTERRTYYFWVGLLHDFGRYFDIAASSFKGGGMNHAQVGADVLFQYRMVRMFPVLDEMYSTIEMAIRFHGVRNLEEAIAERNLNLTSFEHKLCEDIRTADKWDIFDFLLWRPCRVVIGTTEEKIAEMEVSAKTLEELTNRQPINRTLEGEEYTHMRHFLSHVGFIYDDCDPRLLKWVKDTNWVDKYLDRLPNPRDKEHLDQIRKVAKEYLEGC